MQRGGTYLLKLAASSSQVLRILFFELDRWIVQNLEYFAFWSRSSGFSWSALRYRYGSLVLIGRNDDD